MIVSTASGPWATCCKDVSKRNAIRLAIFASATLYFELAIIRFTSAEVLYLGYFSNFILISSFAGLGLGFLSVSHSFRLPRYLPFLLLFLFAIVLVSQFDASSLRDKFGLFFFGSESGQSGLPGAVMLIVLFVSTVAFFCCMGRLVGEAFAEFSPLKAYTLDIAGSLVGIALFFVQSMFWCGPVTWVVTGCLLLVAGYTFAPERPEIGQALHLVLAGLATILLLMSSHTGKKTIWSMYQKLEYEELTDPEGGLVLANSIPHQFIQPVKFVKQSWYGYPYALHQKNGGALDNLMIIGAGTGTDVAVALSMGAAQIDAVEIDPGILQLGREYSPDRPYADPRVRVHVADGRAFLRNADEQYDVIVFALPDSLMRISSISNVRLESYLFTLECLRDAKAHLKPGGSLVLYNQYRWDWLKQKIAAMLTETFGHGPFQKEMGSTTLFVIGDAIGSEPVVRTGFTRLATDNWPFVYMQKPGVHWLYLSMIALFLGGAVIGIRFLAPPGTLRRPDWAFFFMGAAFLLLETKSISFFSLLFGTTWMVNSLAFAGVLTSVLIANLIVFRFRIRHAWMVFGLLMLSLLVAYLCPTAALLNIEAASLRYLAGIVLVFAPIFFATLIFSREFRDVEASTRAFGWNLLGAVSGGGLEYLSLLVGQRNLLWLVAACYLIVGTLLYRERRRCRMTNG